MPQSNRRTAVEWSLLAVKCGRQHYHDDAETEKKEKKKPPRKKARGDICTVGQFSWGKVNKKKGRKTHKLCLINLCERENKLLSVWKIITPVGGSRQEKEGGGRKREEDAGKQRKS